MNDWAKPLKGRGHQSSAPIFHLAFIANLDTHNMFVVLQLFSFRNSLPRFVNSCYTKGKEFYGTKEEFENMEKP